MKLYSVSLSILLLRGRLLADEHPRDIRSELLPALVQHTQEPILASRFPSVVPFFRVACYLAVPVRLDRQERVDRL